MTEAEKKAETSSPFVTTVEETETWQRVIKVEIERAHFDQEYAKRLHTAAKDHKKPGFRKGKTPKAIVENELGDQLRAQTFEAMVPRVYHAAIIEHELKPISDPDLKNLVFEPDKPLTFDLVIEVRPAVEATDYDDLPVAERRVNVEDTEVDSVLERLRDSRAIFDRVERAAADGDQLVVDLIPGEDDGTFDASKTIAEQKLLIGSENNLPVFNEQLAGAAAGQEEDLAIDYPDDYPNPEMAGQTKRFRVTVKEVQQKILPELDDAFANSLQEGQTLLDVRRTIREDLLKEQEAANSRDLDEQIINGLIERHELDVPPSLVEQYVKSGIEELHSRNLQRGLPNSDEDDQKYGELTRPIAERVLKGMFIMEAIRRQENIKVTDEEVDNRITEIATENGFDVDKYREYAAKGEERSKIVHGLEERKTYDFLLSRAAVTAADEQPDTDGQDS